ncbi:MAG: VOC family protein [Bacteroidales bacterium]|nr:VOC family protein [Bacteroidales bacterium]
MIQHVGLAINDTSEINDFYVEVMQFTIHHSFCMDEEVNRLIFGLDGKVDVCLMEKEGSQLELFVNHNQEKKRYAHICLSVSDAGCMFDKAQEKGYKAVAKPNREGRYTYFIWDRSGNMFEIKENRP